MSVRLEPMPEQEFRAFVERAIPNYAEAQITAGSWSPKEALEKAKQAYARLLPETGIPQNQRVFSIVDVESSKGVGVIWFLIDRDRSAPQAFICEFEIWEDCRRQGYGTQALHALETEVRALGINRVGLHVFGHNHPARTLYEKMGYRIAHVNMVKELER